MADADRVLRSMLAGRIGDALEFQAIASMRIAELVDHGIFEDELFEWIEQGTGADVYEECDPVEHLGELVHFVANRPRAYAMMYDPRRRHIVKELSFGVEACVGKFIHFAGEA